MFRGERSGLHSGLDTARPAAVCVAAAPAVPGAGLPGHPGRPVLRGRGLARDGARGRLSSASGRPKASGLTWPASPRPRCRTTRTSSKRRCGTTCTSLRPTARTVWSDTNWGNHVIFNVYGPKGNNAPSPGNWAKAQHVDLAAWQAFYRGSNNSSPPRSDQPRSRPSSDVMAWESQPSHRPITFPSPKSRRRPRPMSCWP